MEFERFEFRVFLLLGLLPYQGWRAQSVLLFTYIWREDNWIHTFPKSISAMWNANSLIQGLNLGHCVHFLWQYPLHPKHLLYIMWHFRKTQCIYINCHEHLNPVNVSSLKISSSEMKNLISSNLFPQLNDMTLQDEIRCKFD